MKEEYNWQALSIIDQSIVLAKGKTVKEVIDKVNSEYPDLVSDDYILAWIPQEGINYIF